MATTTTQAIRHIGLDVDAPLLAKKLNRIMRGNATFEFLYYNQTDAKPSLAAEKDTVYTGHPNNVKVAFPKTATVKKAKAGHWYITCQPQDRTVKTDDGHHSQFQNHKTGEKFKAGDKQYRSYRLDGMYAISVKWGGKKGVMIPIDQIPLAMSRYAKYRLAKKLAKRNQTVVVDTLVNDGPCSNHTGVKVSSASLEFIPASSPY